MSKTPVIIFEDTDALRMSLCLLINRSDQYEVVASYPNCTNVLEAIKEHSPKVVMMDIDMPEVNGIEGLRMIKENDPSIHVIMITVFDDSDHVFEAMQSGADGYLLKRSKPAQIIKALDEVLEGGAPMTPIIAKKVLSFFSRKREPENGHGLTPKEKEVLKLLVDGFSYKMVANELGVTIETVRTHIKNIYRKLQVNSMSEAVVKAIREDLI